MCTQINKRWACGHTGFYTVKICENLFKSCKGTTAKHEIVDDPVKCGDCHRKETLPDPLVAK